MYNFNHLYYFYTTVKSGGVTAAAKHLHLSQPSLSGQLKVLEQCLDIKLFQKVGRRKQITQSGSVVYGFCRQMFELSEQMSELLSRKAPATTKRILVGISNQVERASIVDVVALFLNKIPPHARPKISLIAGTHEELIERLRFREIDVAFTEIASTAHDIQNLERVDIPVTLLAHHKFEHPGTETGIGGGSLHDKTVFFSHYIPTIKELIHVNESQWVILSPFFKIRADIDQFFGLNQIRPNIVFESDFLGAVVRSVIDEIGLTLLPSLYVMRELNEQLIKIIGPPNGYWKYRLWMLGHTQNQDDPLISLLREAFQEICNQVCQYE